MFKNIFYFFVVIFFIFLIIPVAHACDPLGCMFGHKQDTLILGEVMSVLETRRYVKVFFVFPEAPARSLKEGDQIAVSISQTIVNLTDEEVKTITPGKKYLMSLNKKDNFYIPAWGIYEITGTGYVNAKLVKNQDIQDEALQIFINSGGTERDFAFDYSGDKPILIRNQKNGIVEQIFLKKNIIWYGGIVGVLALTEILVFILRKKK